MSSPPKEEAGMNTPPKNNNLENIAPNTESILETDQKVEAPNLLKQEQEVPNQVTLLNRGLGTPLNDAAHQDPDKELALIIEETFRMVQSLRREQEREHLEQLAKAQALRESKHEEMKKLTKHLQETKMQEPTVGTQEDVKEEN
ncbi:hypothetical protein FBULB1_11150 [Fusarium bulbicola]|nr:hypothetical protein FBULB1_11150 [Fusarium bulbicola]